jgi:hypothetical protein
VCIAGDVSDPFVQLSFLNSQTSVVKRSRHVRNNLNPIWRIKGHEDAVFDFVMETVEGELRIELFDKSTALICQKPLPLGRVRIRVIDFVCIAAQTSNRGTGQCTRVDSWYNLSGARDARVFVESSALPTATIVCE